MWDSLQHALWGGRARVWDHPLNVCICLLSWSHFLALGACSDAACSDAACMFSIETNVLLLDIGLRCMHSPSNCLIGHADDDLSWRCSWYCFNKVEDGEFMLWLCHQIVLQLCSGDHQAKEMSDLSVDHSQHHATLKLIVNVSVIKARVMHKFQGLQTTSGNLLYILQLQCVYWSTRWQEIFSQAVFAVLDTGWGPHAQEYGLSEI